MHTLKTLLTLTMLLLVGICFCSLPATFADEANSEKKDKQVAKLATAIEDLQLSKKERKQALSARALHDIDRWHEPCARVVPPARRRKHLPPPHPPATNRAPSVWLLSSSASALRAWRRSRSTQLATLFGVP